MTTSIYFFLMAASIFVIPQLLLRSIVGYPVWDKKIRFLIYAALLPLLWHMLVPRELNDIRYINFLQHGIGGGVAVGLVSIYLLANFKEKFASRHFWDNGLIQAIFVYACVSAFGVGNELLEFLLDWTNIGIFSADRYDVWFDLFANTLGAFVVFIFWKMATLVRK